MMDDTDDHLEAKGHLDDHWTIQAMIRFGGSFVEALGRAATKADMYNLMKIRHTWPEYWKKYAKIGREMRDAQEGARE